MSYLSDKQILAADIRKAVEANYKFTLERWHQSKREMGHLSQPMPDAPKQLDITTADKIRDEVKMEWERSC